MATRKTRRARVTTPSLDLPPPRPLSGLERELYELLTADLQDAVERRLKAERRKSKVVAELAGLAQREEKLRAQLVQFEPELDGVGNAMPTRTDGAHAPPAQ